MRRKAIISVVSKQTDGDGNKIEVVTPGEFYKENNDYYAVYEETELSGMEGTKTTLKISSDKLLLLRVGTTNAEMKFKKNNKDTTLYNTPYGALEISVETKDLKINIDNNGGDVLVNYNLAVAGQKSQNTILEVNIKA
jgi:uncharacterized beta-barrel protein YwiB (DUF1934 family)